MINSNVDKNKCVFENQEKNDSMLYHMNCIVQNIANEKIRNYWNKNVENKNVDVWNSFIHCCCMTIDKDIDEYLNCLKAMEVQND